MINKFLPVLDELAPLIDHVRAVMTEKGESDAVGAVIRNMQSNAQLQAKHGGGHMVKLWRVLARR